MSSIVQFFRSRPRLVLFSLVWILIWIVPWGKSISLDQNLYLIFLVDMLKLGIALGIFLLPGVLLYILLRGDDSSLELLSALPIGFALSVAIIAVIGILGRLLGLSFVIVKSLFILVGLAELILLSYFKPGFSMDRKQIWGQFQGTYENVALWLALILALSMTFNGYQFFIDDTTYAAYATNWQFSTHLGFANIVHHIDLVESERFWLALYPMGQALLSDLSGIPGILLFSNYLELFLVPLAVVTAYWFARFLGLSRQAAGFSVLIQVVLYVMMLDEAWPVGFWFFQNMAEDKVSGAFLLAPVFFAFVFTFLQSSAARDLVLIFLCGAALMLTHPVILFLSCAIAGGVALLSGLMKRTGWRDVLRLFIPFVILMLPYAGIRLYGLHSAVPISFDAESVKSSFQAERYVNVVNNVFYGLNPEVLKLIDISPESDFYSAFQIFRLLPVFLALVAGILAFRKLRDGPLYWYTLACVLLVAFATIPYTGWILGYFLSARLISRASWFSPLGLVGGLVILPAITSLQTNPHLAKFRKSSVKRGGRVDEAAKSVLTIFAFTGIMLVLVILPRAPLYFHVLDNNRQLAQAGAYIDQNTTGPVTVIALGYADTQMLPGVAAHTNLISFRDEKPYNGHNSFLSLEQIEERMYASRTIRSLDPSVSAEERCRLLSEYNVKFVLTPSDRTEEFLAEVKKGGIVAKSVLQMKDLVLLELE